MNRSHWQQTATLPHFPSATAARYDVVVIGGGITGLCAAYFLKRAGKKVCVLERDRICFGDTGHTTAHLTQVTDTRLTELVRDFGEDAAQLTWQAGAAAITALEGIARESHISCRFERIPNYLHASLRDGKDETDDLRDEAELARKLGFEAEFLSAAPFVNRPAVRYPDQGRFHPLKFLAGVAQAVEGDGCAVFENSEVTEVSNDPLAVLCGDVRLECDYVVIATHVPLMGKTGYINATLLQTRLNPQSTYVVAAKVPKGSIPDASFYDTSDPYYYLRLDRTPRYDYVIFGGEDHKTGQIENTGERYQRLESLLKGLAPEAEFYGRWSGQVIETNDGLPLMGETSERQFVATGFGGNGMTFGCLAGLMACDAALGKKNPWQDLFSVSRTNIRGGTWDYVKQNSDYPYYIVADRFSRAEGDSFDDVAPGEGKILASDGKRVACSKDDRGNVCAVSAICTHMGCFVHWNQAERTWDCPCHGSRFHPSGEVLAGPAETPLESVEVEATAGA
jgi:glycine/D-amino acid oxidase-like deaminating enzyme/nitrite reductase/ring-hydroxylating ferredoxin subunit